MAKRVFKTGFRLLIAITLIAIYLAVYPIQSYAAVSITTLGTNSDNAGTSPWTALTGKSLTAGDYVFVMDAGDSGSTAVHAKVDETYYESYGATTSNWLNFYGSIQLGQYITASHTFTLDSLALQFGKTNSPSGNLNVSIYTTDASHFPTGSAISTGSIACSSVPNLTTFRITLSACEITSGTEYAIVVSAPDADSSNYFSTRGGTTDTKGEAIHSNDAGVNWAVDTGKDMYYYMYLTARDFTLTADVTATNAGNVVAKIWSVKITATSTSYYIVITNTSTAKAMTAVKASGLVSSNAWDDTTDANTTGTGTARQINTAANPTNAGDLAVCVVGIEQHVDDGAGTWESDTANDCHANAQFNGTTGGGSAGNICVDAVADVTDNNTTVEHGHNTGPTNADYAIAIGTYKVVTAAVPTVTQSAFTSVASTTATANGNITNGGGSSITERGVCYNTTGAPTTADTTTHDHTDATGAYTENMASLTAGQIYHTKMYAINSTGTGYSSELDFYTLPGDPSSLASAAQTAVTIDITWTLGTGGDKIMIRYRSDGTYPTSVSDGTQGYFGTGTSTTLTGLAAGTTYKIRAWACDTTPEPDNYSSGTSDLTQATTAYSIGNTPADIDFGIVANGSTRYAKGTAPNNPVIDGDCTFTLSNSGDAYFDVDMHIDDFTGVGGTTWNIVSTAPGSNEVRVTAYYSSQNPASGLVLANTDAEFYDALQNGTHIHWDFKIEFGTLANENIAHSATLTVTAVAED